MAPDNTPSAVDYDVVVVGAGFSGLYMLKRVRDLGMSATLLEAGSDVGGTWYWNRYPGARCDVATLDYTYFFDPELEDVWTWSEKYAKQPEIERYLQFVADRYELRRDIQFDTRLEAAHWIDGDGLWRLEIGNERALNARYLVMATGCLSIPKVPDLPGLERFDGELYSTSSWPADPVDFADKSVAVFGTGSSGIQVIPRIAEQARELLVMQRTPSYTLPAKVEKPIADRKAWLESDRAGYRAAGLASGGGVPVPTPTQRISEVSPEEVKARFDDAWDAGELYSILSMFTDVMVEPEANAQIAELVHEKIRTLISDPDTADSLCPKDYLFGTRRPCLDSGYYDAFNQSHVRLVDLHKHPLKQVTETGLELVDETLNVDAIVLATGFDAITGALLAVDIRGRDGRTLRDAWGAGPAAYLGLMSVDFPNLFMVTGPASPGPLSNMAMAIQQHVEWISTVLELLGEQGFDQIEPTQLAQDAWMAHVADTAAMTLYPTANSWYAGANVPGKPRVFIPYIGGVGPYRAICDEVLDRDLLGFTRRGARGETTKDGVIRQMPPDVAGILAATAAMDPPLLETMSAGRARLAVSASYEGRPRGPELATVVDGTYPGAAGELAYRVYTPIGEHDGPLGLVLYLHGGGWTLGGIDSNDPLCRDLCSRTGAVVVSADSRHAPEHRFPAAADDAVAALRWVADNAGQFGASADRLIIAGWSAGGNLAAVASQAARGDGPEIAGQVLICPVTDCDFSRESYARNGDDFLLPASTMRWFWDNYADDIERLDPRASPLRADDLTGLPPALVVTCEFDPLRDEGLAYASAMVEAGNRVDSVTGRGLIHPAVTMVGVMPSSAPLRKTVADWIRATAAPAAGAGSQAVGLLS